MAVDSTGGKSVDSDGHAFIACMDSFAENDQVADSFTRLNEWIQSTNRGPVSTSLYDQINDGRLLSLLWHHLSSDRKPIAAQARSCLEAILGLLEKATVDLPSTSASTLAETTAPPKTSKRSSKKVQQRPAPSPEPPLLSNLLQRSLEFIERRSSLAALDVLQSRYGTDYLLKRDPELYKHLFQSSLLSGDASKRAKIAHSVLEYQGMQMGVLGKKEEAVLNAKNQEAWLRLWVPLIDDEMKVDGEKKLHCLIAYHLPLLLELAPWSLVPLVNLLCRSSSTITLLAVLKSAKELDLCRVGDVCKEEGEVLLGDNGDDTPISYSTKVLVIPTQLLASFLTSSSAQEQSAALSILVESKSPASPVSVEELRLTQLHVTLNFSQTDADLRQTTLVKLNKLCLRLKAVCHAANHTLLKAKERKLDDVVQIESDTRLVLEKTQSFLLWLFQRACHATHPGSPYHITRTGINLLDMLLVLGVDPNYSPPERKMGRAKANVSAGQAWPFSLTFVSPWLVTRLLECHGSTYFDIQSTAREILLCLPSPLPAEDEQRLADSILESAKELMLSPREYQSEAGASLSSLYLEIYINRLAWTWKPLATLRNKTDKQEYSDRQLLFIDDHLCFLHELLDASQLDSRLVSAQRFPLHGTFITLQRLINSIDMTKTPTSELQRLVKSIVSVIDRTWEVTRGILCNSAPEGSVSGDSDHEMARALEEVKLEETDDTFGTTPKYQLLLTYSWRGMKEASAFLGVIVTKTLSAGPTKSQEVWTSEELEGVGRRFNTWLSMIRHRGAFSTIYPAYSVASAALIKSGWKEVDQFPTRWLSYFLATVASPESSFSTTRRSAGIGYAVLAILGSFPRDAKLAVVSDTMKRLTDIVESNPSQPAQIHALNILRVIVADANLAESLDSSIGLLFILVIPRFTSTSWHIRNASMMLYSELTIRAFGKSFNRDGVSFKLDWQDFFTRFPGLDAVLLDRLNEHTLDPNSDLHQSSLFAVLLALSKLKKFTDDEQEWTSGSSASAFAVVIEKCLCSPIWKLREIAATAYAATVTPSRSLSACQELIIRCNGNYANATHGRLLAVQRILVNHLDEREGTSGKGSKAGFIEILPSLHSLASRSGQNRATMIVCLEITNLFQTESTPLDEQYRFCIELIQAEETESSTKSPLYRQLMSTCANFILSRSGNNGVDLLMKHNNQQVRNEAIRYMLEADDKDSFALQYPAILQLLVNEMEQVTTRMGAARLLDQMKCPLQGQALLDACRLLSRLALQGSNLVYRDQCLPCLSRMLAAGYEESNVPTDEYNGILIAFLTLLPTGSKAEESIESRLSTVRASNGIKSILFPLQPSAIDNHPTTSRLLFQARIAMLDLLEDDDEDVRLEAADVIKDLRFEIQSSATNSSLNRILEQAQVMPRSSTASVELLWNWMDRFYCLMKPNLWQEWIQSILVTSTAKDSNTSTIDASLFAEEKPNQYIDELDRLERAAKYCERQGIRHSTLSEKE